MASQQIGPLPVEAYVDGSRLVLRHASGELSFTIGEAAGVLQLRALMAQESPRAKAKHETEPKHEACLAPGCGKPIEQAPIGRRRRYCDARCGLLARREARERKEAEERQVGRRPESGLMARMRDQLRRGAA
jgi:hypothetical protein